MNQNILQKAIEELKKEQPKIDYVLGMLETLYELGTTPLQITSDLLQIKKDAPNLGMGNKPEQSQDEAAVLDAKARAAIEHVKALNSEPQ